HENTTANYLGVFSNGATEGTRLYKNGLTDYQLRVEKLTSAGSLHNFKLRFIDNTNSSNNIDSTTWFANNGTVLMPKATIGALTIRSDLNMSNHQITDVKTLWTSTIKPTSIDLLQIIPQTNNTAGVELFSFANSTSDHFAIISKG